MKWLDGCLQLSPSGVMVFSPYYNFPQFANDATLAGTLGIIEEDEQVKRKLLSRALTECECNVRSGSLSIEKICQNLIKDLEVILSLKSLEYSNGWFVYQKLLKEGWKLA